MRTRIELGSSGSIDLMDSVPYSLNFAIADIRTPDKRDASYSKTIKIPGSKNNDMLFAHIFEIDIDCNFNPNIKTPAIIYIDEVSQLKGFLQLLKIYTTDDNKKEYEVTIKGQIGNVFTAIGDAELTNLDLSEFDHQYIKANQVASWSAPVGIGYVYPMIDYGQTSGITYNVNNFFPAIYVKTYLDKIFAYSGYYYSSNFFNSEFFKRLIVPYNGVGFKQVEIDLTSVLCVVDSSLSAVNSYLLPTTGYTDPVSAFIKYDFLNTDPSFQYNFSTYRFVSQYTGTCQVTANGHEMKVDTGTALGGIEILKYHAGVYTSVAGSPPANLTTTFTPGLLAVSGPIGIEAGDELLVGYRVKRTGTGTASLLQTSPSGDFSVFPLNAGVVDGSFVSMNSTIPLKIKMKDFFTSLMKMFNLYIETDKFNEYVLNIEPRNDFYSSGTTIDWTDKWDVSKEMTQEPMGALDARKYVYTYTDDKDYYNTLYKNAFIEAYGTMTFDVTNDFLTQTKENKVIFSPTPLYDGSGTDRVVSVMMPDLTAITTLKGTNIRILYYGGLFTTANPWTYTSFISGTSTETEYPYAGHLDDPFNPTLDLSFAVPKEVYYFTTIYTNNHLFNKYHRQFVEEITDKDSKIVTVWLYLTPYDILSLDFRNQFFIDGHLLRLNKIYDYNPIIQEITKCEFIKIKQASQFVPQRRRSNGGIDVLFNR